MKELDKELQEMKTTLLCAVINYITKMDAIVAELKTREEA